MEIFIKTISGEVISGTSFILGQEGVNWVVSNQDRLKIVVGSKDLCDDILSKIWDSIREACTKNESVVMIKLTGNT